MNSDPNAIHRFIFTSEAGMTIWLTTKPLRKVIVYVIASRANFKTATKELRTAAKTYLLNSLWIHFLENGDQRPLVTAAAGNHKTYIQLTTQDGNFVSVPFTGALE